MAAKRSPHVVALPPRNVNPTLSLALNYSPIRQMEFRVTWLRWKQWAAIGPIKLRRQFELEMEFVLRPTVSRPVRLGIGPLFGAHGQILSFSSFSFDNYFVVLPRAPSLRRGRVCSLQCNRWLVRSLTTNNHTLLSYLRLSSLFVASYDSQGLRWKYSNPPPHGEKTVPWYSSI
jgi:hypothetical protein